MPGCTCSYQYHARIALPRAREEVDSSNEKISPWENGGTCYQCTWANPRPFMPWGTELWCIHGPCAYSTISSLAQTIRPPNSQTRHRNHRGQNLPLDKVSLCIHGPYVHNTRPSWVQTILLANWRSLHCSQMARAGGVALL